MNAVKQLAKRAVSRIAPGVSASFFAARARAHSQRWFAETGRIAASERLVGRLGLTVRSGPFAHTRLGEMARRENMGPFVLGVYESELDAAWASVFRRGYTQIVDVGSKFGYYAAGLAMKYPEAEVVAFDVDPWARRATAETAAANRLRNVRVLGACTPGWLAAELRPGALVLSDCEGYEDVLFAAASPALATATLLIEAHEHFVPGVTRRLTDRFAPTHDLATFGPETPKRPRDPAIDLSFLPPSDLPLLEDVRADDHWLLFTPRGA
jgi:hypothetical protein